jgi:hypothetical protein
VTRTADDRDLVPEGGQSARQAGARLQAFLASIRGRPGPVAAVTHGGVTIELLRTLLGDDALPPGLLAAGMRHHHPGQPEPGHHRIRVTPAVTAGGPPERSCSTRTCR